MNILSQLTSAIVNADSYKVSHWSQYPAGTEYVSSYIEPRSSRYAKAFGAEHDYAVFFGLQAYVKEYLAQPVTQEDVDLAEVFFAMHGEPFNKDGWQYIVDHHGGKLPIEVRALEEGTVLKTSNALVEIVNTDPKCFWLTSYVETALLRAVWYPTTVATKSRLVKEICRDALIATTDDAAIEGTLDFMLHDFGARGVSSNESSALAGAAHLVNFKGTDTVMGALSALMYYNPAFDAALEVEAGNAKRAMIRVLKDMQAKGEPLPAFSVEASEHSTMTITGRAGEEAQVKALIEKAKQGRIVSIVSDSYDYYNTVRNMFGGSLKNDVIEAGANGGRVVIRPDSGDPVEVVVNTLKILDETFGTTVNGKGYKVLPPYLRVLQGDGIDLGSLHDMVDAVKAAGFSIENVVFGMGGGLEQKVTRDDLNFAQKASAARINGVWHDVYKDPITADVNFVKKSKRGRLSTVFDGAAFTTKRTADLAAGEVDSLQPVFRNGEVLRMQSFDAVRKLAEDFTALARKAAHVAAAPVAALKAKPATPKVA